LFRSVNGGKNWTNEVSFLKSAAKQASYLAIGDSKPSSDDLIIERILKK